MPTETPSKHPRRIAFSLRFSILVIFITLFVSAILTLITFNYVHSSKILLDVASTLMQKASKSVKEELFEQLNNASELSKTTADSIQSGILNIASPQLILYTAGIVKKFPIIDAAWMGEKNGNFILAETEEDKTISSEIFNRDVNPATRMMINRNLNNQIIQKKYLTDLSYDPRTQFWYQQAKKAKKLIWTDIYVINVLNRPNHYIAVIAASPVYAKDGKFLGVFGLDMTLNYLTNFIATQKVGQHGITYIVRSDGKLISFPGLKQQMDLMDIHATNNPWLIKSFEIYKKTGVDHFTFIYHDKKYLAAYTTIPTLLNQGWLIGLVVPENDFIGELRRSTINTTLFGLSLLVIGIILISSLVTRMVKPLNRLVDQTEKIKHFELDNDIVLHSRIKEINTLSEAILSMQLGLKAFQKYVPAALVRQLIEAGEHAKIGGAKKNLTIFFSDIENFTMLSEKMDPNSLMEHVCHYFEEMSHILIEEKCTIDKYIGDSVMGFWGAPLAVDLPCEHAANAALKCMKRLAELNAVWKKEGKPILITRMGLHKGEAIVGNIGSSERLNYTAIGDAINVASRLEELNKSYGTKIIVSRAVYDEIKDQFVLRKLDEVTIRGRTGSDAVYELLAKDKKELNFDIDKYTIFFEKAFQAHLAKNNKEAAILFNECLEVYPEDTIAIHFLKNPR